MSQTIYIPTEYPRQTGWTADVYPDGSDTAAAYGLSLTEETNRKGMYSATTTDLSGLYYLIVYDSAGNFVGDGWFSMPTGGVCTLQKTSAEAQLDFSGSGGTLKSESTNMRGTDGAITSLAGIATATNVSDAANSLAAYGDARWATATGFATPGDKMDLVDAPNSTAIAAIQSGLSTFDASSDGVILADSEDVYHADVNMGVDAANSRNEYLVTWFKNGVPLTSGITSPTIKVVKFSDGTNLISQTSMTQVGSTGSYKYTTGTVITAGEPVSVVLTASIDSATRTWTRNLSRDSSS